MPYGYIPRTEIDAYAVQQGRWVIGLVETTIYWPSRNALVDYEACRFLLMPAQPIPDTAPQGPLRPRLLLKATAKA